MAMSTYMKNLREKVGNDLIMMPAVSAIIMDDEGKILLQQRSDNKQWATPGGAIDPKEEPADAIIREVFEETGLHIIPEHIIGVYGGEENFMVYPNGDEVSIISIVFKCTIKGGTLRINDDESIDLRFFAFDNLPTLHPRYRIRIECAQLFLEKTYFKINPHHDE